MKQGTIALLFLAILASLTGCKRNPYPFSDNSKRKAILDVKFAEADSLDTEDPWILFSYEERQGKRLYEHYCMVCHGQAGEGDGFNSYNLQPPPHSFADSAYISALSDESLAQIIALGGRGVNKSVQMPAYQHTLSTEQISYIIAYIRTFIRTKGQTK